jgi:hypothetical protein
MMWWQQIKGPVELDRLAYGYFSLLGGGFPGPNKQD